MRFIIFDLEATCWTGFFRPNRQEVIEIGAYKLDRFGDEISCFKKFVRPVVHPYLSPFCKKLTTITQVQVNEASGFSDVWNAFTDWVLQDDLDFILCSWGDDDRRLLLQDCDLHKEEPSILQYYLDVKTQYNIINGHQAQMLGLSGALRREGIDFSGTPHRALDDAFNLAQIFVRYIDEWQF